MGNQDFHNLAIEMEERTAKIKEEVFNIPFGSVAKENSVKEEGYVESIVSEEDEVINEEECFVKKQFIG